MRRWRVRDRQIDEVLGRASIGAGPSFRLFMAAAYCALTTTASPSMAIAVFTPQARASMPA